MAKLYTRTGDAGQTGLFDGSRVSKGHPRVRAYGSVDELNALLGLCRSTCEHADLSGQLEQVQNDLFAIGAELATPPGRKVAKTPRVGPSEIGRLESWIDAASAAAPPLGAFVLPSGTELACRLHHARTVCRRAERDTVCLASGETVENHVLAYLNRLSDLLFAWTRAVNHRCGVVETTWKSSPAP